MNRIVLAATIVAMSSQAAIAAEFHIAPKGADTNPGTREKPLATLAAARDSIRKLKKAGPLAEPSSSVSTVEPISCRRPCDLQRKTPARSRPPLFTRPSPAPWYDLLAGGRFPIGAR